MRPTLALLLLLLTAAPLAFGATITATDLLDPKQFPEAAMGMAVQSATDAQDEATVVTTGATFIINKQSDTVECRQRIGKERTLATLSLPKGALQPLKLASQTSGAAILSGGGTTLRVNGDSVLMLSLAQGGRIQADVSFAPDALFEVQGNYNIFDPAGGISFFEHGSSSASKLEPGDQGAKATWEYPPGGVFWAAVNPPKPFDWEKSIKNRYVFYGSSFEPYPSDADIARYSKYGNILHIQSEMMLWKKWQSDVTPRNLPELKRVVATAHRHGMKVILYVTPLYYLKGTPRESEQRIDPDPDPTVSIGHVTSWGRPDNEHFFLEQISNSFKISGIDGFYFDGMYFAPSDLAAAYHLTRATRELVGKDGVLSYHASVDTPSLGGLGSRTHFPALNAYWDYMVRGEGEEANVDPTYLRYFQSTYNLSNSIALSCNFTEYRPSKQHLDMLLQHNIRMPVAAAWMGPDNYAETVLDTYYWPKVAQTRAQVEAKLLEPIGAYRREREYEQALSKRMVEERQRGASLKPEDFAVPGAVFKGGYWRFEEPAGLRVFDGTPNQHHATIERGVMHSDRTFAAQVPGLKLPNTGCLEFDGRNGSAVGAGRDPSLNVGTLDFTLEGWVHPRAAQNRPVLAGKRISGVTSPPDTGFELLLLPVYETPAMPTYRVQFSVRQNPGEGFEVLGPDIRFNEWHHIAGVREGTELRLYVDGKLVGRKSIPANLDLSSNQEFAIGSGREGGGGMWKAAFDGYIDEVRFTIGKALPPEQMLATPAEPAR